MPFYFKQCCKTYINRTEKVRESVANSSKIMTENTERFNSTKENVLLQTLKLTINLFTHVLISLVVFVCLWYSCRSSTLSVLELHIVLCVLGYQLFMCQGILVLTKFNSWSLYIKRRHRRTLHWFFAIVGTVMVFVGSLVIIIDKRVNFNTTHGILGLCALITTSLSVINGTMTSFASKLTCPGNFVTSAKWIHGFTGIVTLFLSAASLHYGFDKQSFKRWIDNENFLIILKFFTWLFTVFVSKDFWVIMGQRISYKTNMGKSQRS